VSDADEMLRQIGFPFMFGILPSALVGLFPLWLALRRRRPLIGALAFVTCGAVGFLMVVATGVNAFNMMTIVVYGLLAGLAAALAWSAIIVRTTA
jgi:hypothetical protein